MDQEKIGEKLANLRKRKGLSQRELGEKIGATDKTVSRWERGTYLPDIDMLVVLANFYSISVDEILCSEKLASSENSLQTKEVEGKKIRGIKILPITLISITCFCLVAITMFCAFFFSARKMALYPSGINYEQINKEYKGNISLQRQGEGKTILNFEESGAIVRLTIPNDFTETQKGTFIKDNSFIRISCFKENDYAYPVNLSLNRYFEETGVSRFIDKVKFAYTYPLNNVTVFSSENEIEIAGGCRMMQTFCSIANENGVGDFYFLEGDYRGYIITSSPQSSSAIVYAICLESGESLCFITICAQEMNLLQNVKDFISAISFN